MKKPVQHTQIIVADDHPIVLIAIADALGMVPGFRVTATAQSGSGLLKLLGSTPCDLIVTDFSMQRDKSDKGEEDGLSLIVRLRRLYPDTPIVVFTMITNGGIILQLRQIGVAGIVGKDEQIGTLTQVCQRALVEERTVLSPRINARLAPRPAPGGGVAKPSRRAYGLTTRELEVVRLFALGMTVTEISVHLNRSLSTITTQKRSAMRKLHLDNNIDLIRYSAEHGFS